MEITVKNLIQIFNNIKIETKCARLSILNSQFDLTRQSLRRLSPIAESVHVSMKCAHLTIRSLRMNEFFVLVRQLYNVYLWFNCVQLILSF